MENYWNEAEEPEKPAFKIGDTAYRIEKSSPTLFGRGVPNSYRKEAYLVINIVSPGKIMIQDPKTQKISVVEGNKFWTAQDLEQEQSGSL